MRKLLTIIIAAFAEDSEMMTMPHWLQPIRLTYMLNILRWAQQ